MKGSLVGITEFSQKLSLPKTTIQGIVQTLVELKYLEKDQPVWDLANNFLNQTLEKVFANEDEKVNRLEAFRELCGRRYHNFQPPKPVGENNLPDPDGDNLTGSSSIRNRTSRKPDATGMPAKTNLGESASSESNRPPVTPTPGS